MKMTSASLLCLAAAIITITTTTTTTTATSIKLLRDDRENHRADANGFFWGAGEDPIATKEEKAHAMAVNSNRCTSSFMTEWARVNAAYARVTREAEFNVKTMACPLLMLNTNMGLAKYIDHLSSLIDGKKPAHLDTEEKRTEFVCSLLINERNDIHMLSDLISVQAFGGLYQLIEKKQLLRVIFKNGLKMVKGETMDDISSQLKFLNVYEMRVAVAELFMACHNSELRRLKLATKKQCPHVQTGSIPELHMVSEGMLPHEGEAQRRQNKHALLQNAVLEHHAKGNKLKKVVSVDQKSGGGTGGGARGTGDGAAAGRRRRPPPPGGGRTGGARGSGGSSTGGSPAASNQGTGGSASFLQTNKNNKWTKPEYASTTTTADPLPEFTAALIETHQRQKFVGMAAASIALPYLQSVLTGFNYTTILEKLYDRYMSHEGESKSGRYDALCKSSVLVRWQALINETGSGGVKVQEGACVLLKSGFNRAFNTFVEHYSAAYDRLVVERQIAPENTDALDSLFCDVIASNKLQDLKYLNSLATVEQFGGIIRLINKEGFSELLNGKEWKFDDQHVAKLGQVASNVHEKLLFLNVFKVRTAIQQLDGACGSIRLKTYVKRLEAECPSLLSSPEVAKAQETAGQFLEMMSVVSSSSSAPKTVTTTTTNRKKLSNGDVVRTVKTNVQTTGEQNAPPSWTFDPCAGKPQCQVMTKNRR